MHERRFHREVERLRDPERISRMEVDRVVNLVLEQLPDVSSILDVGTGSGLFAEEFAKRGLIVTGLDANPDMLPVARQFVPAGTFKEGIAEKVPFPDSSFDIVFMGLLLHETDDPQTAVREANRLAIKRVVILEWPEEVGEFGPPAEDRLTSRNIRELADQAGFKSVETHPLEHLVLYLLDVKS